MLAVLRVPGVLAVFATSCLAQLPMGALGLLLILRTRDATGAYAAGGAVAAAYSLGLGVSNPLLARIADRRGQVRLLRTGGPLAAAAIAGEALLGGGAPLVARIALAAVAGAAQPPIGSFRRRLWNVLIADGELRHRAYATEGAVLEVVYLLGPVAIVGGIGAWSVGAALLSCAAVIVAGDLAFARLAAVRGLAGEPPPSRDRAGALRARGVVVALVTFVTLGVTVGATEVGVPAALEDMGHRALTGVALGLWGVGSALAGIAVAHTAAPRRPERRLAVLVAAWGALHALLALAGSPAALAAGLLVAGSVIAPTFTVLNGLLDRIAPPGTLTEAFTWTSTGMTAGIAAGATVAGRLADAVSPAAALALGAAGLAGAGVVLAGRAALRRPTPALAGA